MYFKRYMEQQLKNHFYFIFFFCIGIVLNLDFNWKNECEIKISNNTSSTTTTTTIVTTMPVENELTTATENSNKKLIRPRYYSTELGIREKLFVAVLTSSEQIEERTIAINKTVSHLVDKIKFFMTAYKYKSNHDLDNIVGFTDKRDSLRTFHVIKYISDRFIQNYDYFFIMKDSLYLNARILKNIVTKISVSENVYMGTKLHESSFCSLDSGILLSNSVISAIIENMDWCIKNSFSDNHSENLGRCVAHSINLDCQEDVQGQTLNSFRIRRHGIQKNMNQFISNFKFNFSVVVYPVITSEDIYSLHVHYSKIRLVKVASESNLLAKKIEAQIPELPESYKKISWPIGRRPSIKPKSRFDFSRTIYFNMTHKFFHSDYTNVASLKTIEKLDIEDVMESVISIVEKKADSNLVFRRLINGYRVFDLSRGMDYTLDIGFRDLKSGQEVIKRFQACRPLGNVEIVPVPYVTENVRVTILVMIREKDISLVSDFTDFYLKNLAADRRQKTFLMYVLIYESDSPSKGDNDVFKNIKNLAMKTTSTCGLKDNCKVAWLSIRLPVTKQEFLLNTNVLNIAVVDLGLKKVGTDSLVLVLDAKAIIDPEFLNRVRMNTIMNFQIFNSIPFKLFDPSLIEPEIIPRKNDVNKNTGRFDTNEYKYISFYGKDYVNARLKSQTILPIVRTDKDIRNLMELNLSSKWTIFRIFVKYSEVHCMRATDPGIKIKYFDDVNNFTPYASKNQLAKLILKYGSL